MISLEFSLCRAAEILTLQYLTSCDFSETSLFETSVVMFLNQSARAFNVLSSIGPLEPKFQEHRGEINGSLLLLLPNYLEYFLASAFLAKYKGEYICEELDNGSRLGEGCVTVTSANVGGKSLYIIIKSILPV